MKVLLSVPGLPYPPRKGATIRTFHFLRWLAREHAVSLLSFSNGEAVPAELARLCVEVRTVPVPARTTARRLRDLATSRWPDLALRLRSTEYEAALRRWLSEERFDVVQVESLEMTLPWLAVASEAAPGAGLPLAVFDNLNAEYLLQWRAFITDLRRPERWPAAFYSLVQTAKLRAYERELCRRFDRVIAVSEEDALALRRLGGPPARVSVISNGVDCEYFGFRPAGAGAVVAGARMVFTGTMDFRPNVDAVAWFARRVLPRVRAAVPGAALTIVGASPSSTVRALANLPGVEVTGPVDDVRSYLSAARVYVVPMRMGGGVRLKALEAMAAGVPVVSTGLGCSGIAAVPGVHYYRADDAASFGSATVDLLAGEVDPAAVVVAARRLMETSYDWRQLAPRLAEVYGLGPAPAVAKEGRR